MQSLALRNAAGIKSKPRLRPVLRAWPAPEADYELVGAGRILGNQIRISGSTRARGTNRDRTVRHSFAPARDQSQIYAGPPGFSSRVIFAPGAQHYISLPKPLSLPFFAIGRLCLPRRFPVRSNWFSFWIWHRFRDQQIRSVENS